MKLKTLNAHPALFCDVRALVEKVANYQEIDVSMDVHLEQRDAKLILLWGEARAILEKFEKLEGK